MEIDILPRRMLTTLGLPAEIQRHVSLFLSSFFALFAVPLFTRTPHICLMRALVHLPCPGCGILHSLTALATLRFAQAFAANPAGIAFATLLIFQLIARPIAIAASTTRPFIDHVSHWAANITLAALLSVWFFRIALELYRLTSLRLAP